MPRSTSFNDNDATPSLVVNDTDNSNKFAAHAKPTTMNHSGSDMVNKLKRVPRACQVVSAAQPDAAAAAAEQSAPLGQRLFKHGFIAAPLSFVKSSPKVGAGSFVVRLFTIKSGMFILVLFGFLATAQGMPALLLTDAREHCIHVEASDETFLRVHYQVSGTYE